MFSENISQNFLILDFAPLTQTWGKLDLKIRLKSPIIGGFRGLKCLKCKSIRLIYTQ